MFEGEDRNYKHFSQGVLFLLQLIGLAGELEDDQK